MVSPQAVVHSAIVLGGGWLAQRKLDQHLVAIEDADLKILRVPCQHFYIWFTQDKRDQKTGEAMKPEPYLYAKYDPETDNMMADEESAATSAGVAAQIGLEDDSGTNSENGIQTSILANRRVLREFGNIFVLSTSLRSRVSMNMSSILEGTTIRPEVPVLEGAWVHLMQKYKTMRLNVKARNVFLNSACVFVDAKEEGICHLVFDKDKTFQIFAGGIVRSDLPPILEESIPGDKSILKFMKTTMPISGPFSRTIDNSKFQNEQINKSFFTLLSYPYASQEPLNVRYDLALQHTTLRTYGLFNSVKDEIGVKDPIWFFGIFTISHLDMIARNYFEYSPSARANHIFYSPTYRKLVSLMVTKKFEIPRYGTTVVHYITNRKRSGKNVLMKNGMLRFPPYMLVIYPTLILVEIFFNSLYKDRTIDEIRVSGVFHYISTENKYVFDSNKELSITYGVVDA